MGDDAPLVDQVFVRPTREGEEDRVRIELPIGSPIPPGHWYVYTSLNADPSDPSGYAVQAAESMINDFIPGYVNEVVDRRLRAVMTPRAVAERLILMPKEQRDQVRVLLDHLESAGI